jgi:putative transcriptional regulator
MHRVKPKYKSDAFEAIRSAVAGMYKAGTIDQATMRTFDESCLAALGSIAPSGPPARL